MKRIMISNRTACVIAIASSLMCGCSRKSANSTSGHVDAKAGGSNPAADISARGEGPTSVAGDPAAIVAAVRQNIASNEDIPSSKAIQISYEHGIVKLKGKVATSGE